jgi:predicted lactoylglutathione lyase
MSKTFFLNLRVDNLERTVAFFTELGFKFNPKFTNENGTCMIINDDCAVMFLLPKFFDGFTKKPVVNAKESTGGLYAISLESKDEVNRIAEKALALGAIEPNSPEDLGTMYSRAIEDFDGYQWDFFYMEDLRTPE